MTHTFPTVEWVQELADRLNDIPAYRDSSAGWKGTLVLVALAEPGQLQEDVAIGLDPSGGTITEVHRVPDHKTSGASYTLLAKYSVWKNVIKGKHDILFGLMTGKIKLRGSVFKLMLQLKTPAIMLKEMRAMDTAFYDENQAQQLASV
jgi:putative sterol carrier protein